MGGGSAPLYAGCQKGQNSPHHIGGNRRTHRLMYEIELTAEAERYLLFWSKVTKGRSSVYVSSLPICRKRRMQDSVSRKLCGTNGAAYYHSSDELSLLISAHF